MKISSAMNEMHDLDVNFGGEMLHIIYRPSSVTLADVEKMTADKNPRRLAEMIREQIAQWDLEDDETGKIIPLGKPESPLQVMEQGTELPSEAMSDPIVEKVPIAIMVKILFAIQADQRPDPQA
jgi:hypothetical protein